MNEKSAKVIGIVSEFNPFHFGHAHLIQQVREWAGADCTIICVMSGDFVQRGEPAIFSKYSRAEAACRCGADIVAELPVRYCLSSAEYFAEAAVQILHGFHVTHLAFGVEEMQDISAIAEYLLEDECKDKIIQRLKLQPDLSYPAAREGVLADRFGEMAKCVHNPNLNLGIEYCKAIHKHAYPIELHPILRIGAGHDSMEHSNVLSGSALRKRLQGGSNLQGTIPEAAQRIFDREISEGRGPVRENYSDTVLLGILRTKQLKDFKTVAFCENGLAERLYTGTRCATYQDAVRYAATRRFVEARVRRSYWCAALGIDRDIPPQIHFARVLAINAAGIRYLHALPNQEDFSLITRPAAAKQLVTSDYLLFEETVHSHDIYTLSYPQIKERAGAADWKTALIRCND